MEGVRRWNSKQVFPDELLPGKELRHVWGGSGEAGKSIDAGRGKDEAQCALVLVLGLGLIFHL